MSYRLPEQREHFYDVASQSSISVDNGTISRITIPCLYNIREIQNRKHRMIHDHLGWPSPDHPDSSCQLPPEHDFVIITDEVNLIGEGYTDIEIGLDDPPDGLVMTGDIYDYSNVVITINSMCEDAVKQDVVVPFSVFAIGVAYPDGETETELRDIVTKGTLRIVAGPTE